LNPVVPYGPKNPVCENFYLAYPKCLMESKGILAPLVLKLTFYHAAFIFGHSNILAHIELYYSSLEST